MLNVANFVIDGLVLCAEFGDVVLLSHGLFHGDA